MTGQDADVEVLPMASAMFFGSATFAFAALTAQALLAGDWRALRVARNPKASPLDVRSFASVYALLYRTTALGLIMLYAYLCERHPPFPHAPKTYNRDDFFFLTGLLLLVALFTVERHAPDAETGASLSSAPFGESPGPARAGVVASPDEATEVLNRNQTEEWKGWMQFMFLLYHYHHAEEVYNAIRVMITCYVWMTGFGNASFFYVRADYSLVRVLQMLWRLNFLVLVLMLTQGTTYILYYICFLHTYYFLMVYVTMRTRQDMNYTRMGLRYKLTVLALIIFIVWDTGGLIFRLVHWPVRWFGDAPRLGAKNGMPYEIYFRTCLDHWSTYLGMVFACNFPVVSLFFRRLEAEPFWRCAAAKCLMAVPLLGAVAVWAAGPFLLPKLAYNQTNAFLAPVPLLSYVFLRNLTAGLRSHTLALLRRIGTTTLETYLMQHHIWLTSDAKSLLTLVPGWPKVNFLLVSIIYFAISRHLYQLTLVLRGMLLPNDQKACLRNLAGTFGSILAFSTVASILHLVGLLHLTSVFIVSIGAGGALCYAVSSATWGAYENAPNDSEVTSATAKLLNLPASTGTRQRIPYVFGCLAVLAVGVVWQSMRTHGASKLVPVSSACADAVQQGQWVPVNVCEEDFRGEAYRNFGLSAIGTCAPQSKAYSWGWRATPSSTHCYFSQRDSSTLLSKLDGRSITFVGDSIIRHLYHAACRLVGDSTAGAYNTSMGKWTDFSRRYQNTHLEFRWAPFTDLLISALNNITSGEIQTDLIIIGGGPWDRLHRYSNEKEQYLLKDNVTKLADRLDSIRSSGIPITWITPTTINSWALNTEEKRNNIREDQMAKLRAMYKDTGIHDSVTWVFHGSSFTSDRVNECYDGVHYPLSVYDGGAQILANAFDWLLPPPIGTSRRPYNGPKIGSMAHSFYGLCMLAFAVAALYTMDGFFGLSYLAGLIIPATRPSVLFIEAFTSFHARMNLAPMAMPAVARYNSYNSQDRDVDKSHSSDEAELENLIELASDSTDRR